MDASLRREWKPTATLHHRLGAAPCARPTGLPQGVLSVTENGAEPLQEGSLSRKRCLLRFLPREHACNFIHSSYSIQTPA
jgi:hypothetical protein